MRNIENGQQLYPEVTLDEDGIEWVQITDGFGFAGFDPTDEQIAKALFGDRTNLTQNDALYLSQIITQTREVHEDLVRDGFGELKNEQIGLSKNIDVKRANRAYGIFSEFGNVTTRLLPFTELRYTTDQEGEQ